MVYTVRVPAKEFRGFLKTVGEISHVTSQDQNAENISERYYDTESRLETQKTKMERLQMLLSKAETMEDIIDLENAISETEYQIEQLTQKKADVLDAFFSQQITKDEMKLVNERYDRELGALRVRLEAVRSKGAAAYETEVLREDVQKKITAIVGGETDSEAFYKNLLDRMVVHKDKRVEVYLNLLPQKWTFILEDLRDVNRTLEEKGAVKNKVCKNGPSVPISVSSPFSSG